MKTWNLLFWMITVCIAGVAPQANEALGTIN